VYYTYFRDFDSYVRDTFYVTGDMWSLFQGFRRGSGVDEGTFGSSSLRGVQEYVNIVWGGVMVNKKDDSVVCVCGGNLY